MTCCNAQAKVALATVKERAQKATEGALVALTLAFQINDALLLFSEFLKGSPAHLELQRYALLRELVLMKKYDVGIERSLEILQRLGATIEAPNGSKSKVTTCMRCLSSDAYVLILGVPPLCRT